MSQQRAGNSTDASYELRRARREEAREQAMQFERRHAIEHNLTADPDDVGRVQNDPHAAPELRRRRREQAREHATALAREYAWEEVYMADAENGEHEHLDDGCRSDCDEESLLDSYNSHDEDVISRAIVRVNRLARPHMSNEDNALLDRVIRPLQELHNSLGTSERRELNQYLLQRLHAGIDTSASSAEVSVASGDIDSGAGNSDDDSFEYEVYTTAFDPPTAWPSYRRDSSDSRCSTAASASRYDPNTDSDTGTYDRELYDLTTADLSHEA